MLKELNEKRNALIAEAQNTLETAKKEERAVSEDEMKRYDEIKAEIENIDKQIRMTEEVRQMEMKKAPEEGKKELQTREVMPGLEVRMDEVKEFADYIRTANLRGDPVNLDKDGSADVIPETIGRWITRKVYDISPILQRSYRSNVKGKLSLPYYDITDDHITVGYQDEFVDMVSHVGKFQTVTLDGYLCGALVKVSKSLLNNSDLDLVAFIVDQMGVDIARFIEGELINGTASAVDGLSGLTNTIETATEDVITADDVIELQNSIKDVYQANSIWVMSPGTRTALRLLKDQMGIYLLQNDITAPFGKTLLGKPVYVSDNMEDLDDAGEKPVIFYGDFSGLATKFSENVNITVLREHYAVQHAIGICAYFEFDAKVIDNQKIAGLVNKSE